jgi:glycerate-2-kinase
MGTEELVRIVEKADADDLVIVYVTGGTEGQWSTSTPWRVTEV